MIPITLQFLDACIMKLFERQVDLALFESDTPLYPICRSWMDNDPQENRRLNLDPPTLLEPPAGVVSLWLCAS